MTTPLQASAGDGTAPAGPSLAASLLAAALLLPGVAAQAENAPESASIGLRYLSYQDRQPGLDRIHARSPSVSVTAPVASDWALEGTVTTDAVSGASPRYHTAISGASHMADNRKAMDVAATRYFHRGTLAVGAAFSGEHDYVSRALSLNGTLSSEDNNTTWAFGAAASRDSINPVNRIVIGERKRTASVLAGVTQVLSPNDIGQLTLTHTRGHGYYDDPYKLFDRRPRERRDSTVLVRWNHHLAGLGATTRLSYRWYRDSYGIRAHTLAGEWVQPLGDAFGGGWTVVPELRLYSQRAASFYYDPVPDGRLGGLFPPGYRSGDPDWLSSPDQRLSGFGAVTVGLKVARALNRHWTLDAKYEVYEQRGNWRLFHDGSPGLAPLYARAFQVGVTRRW